VFACGINMFGVNDLERFVDNPIWKDWVGNPDTEAGRTKLKAHSPLTYAAQVTRPMLVSQGGKDMVVPQEQSDIYVAALQKLGKPVTYTLYPDEPHDYTTDIGSWWSFWAYGEQFLRKWLGGKAEPAGNDIKAGRFEWKAGKELIPDIQ
jgi:dipeptidyl aminopeptidase/acylaminoacyl peptidase